MLRIGITGGIGSGKSTVTQIFKVLGIPIYDADTEAKKIMVDDEIVVNAIKSLLGDESYTNGALNKIHIGTKVFNNKSLLAKLNAIVHPAVQQHGIDWHNSQKDIPYTLYEAALIYETKNEQSFDKIITVYANQTTCIKRVQKRNNISRKAVLERIHNQISPLIKKRKADFVINNNDGKQLIEQVLKLHNQICRLNKKR